MDAKKCVGEFMSLPILEVPFKLAIVLAIIAIVIILSETSLHASEKEKTELLDEEQLYQKIGNIIRVTEEPEIEVSCAPGNNEQWLYTVSLKGMKAMFPEKNPQDVYVSVLFKGARAPSEPMHLQPEVEQVLGTGISNELKFIDMISEEPPPIIDRLSSAEYQGELKPLQTLFLNNHTIKLESLENKKVPATEFSFADVCTATVRLQCSEGEIKFSKLFLDGSSCLEQDDTENCQKTFPACNTIAKMRLEGFADATVSCGEKKPVFYFSAGKADDWKIGEPLWVFFWKSNQESGQCWNRERFDFSKRCDLYFLGAYKFAVPPANYKTGCVQV